MKKRRVEVNAKNMRLALQLLEIAFEDLKNIPEFRDDPACNILIRNVVIEFISDIIRVAYKIEKGGK